MQGLFIKPTKIGLKSIKLFAMTYVMLFCSEFNLKIESSEYTICGYPKGLESKFFNDYLFTYTLEYEEHNLISQFLF